MTPSPSPKAAAAPAGATVRPSAFVFRAVTVDTPAGPILRHVDAGSPMPASPSSPGPRGLSGGEAQRMSLARTLIVGRRCC